MYNCLSPYVFACIYVKLVVSHAKPLLGAATVDRGHDQKLVKHNIAGKYCSRCVNVCVRILTFTYIYTYSELDIFYCKSRDTNILELGTSMCTRLMSDCSIV